MFGQVGTGGGVGAGVVGAVVVGGGVQVVQEVTVGGPVGMTGGLVSHRKPEFHPVAVAV